MGFVRRVCRGGVRYQEAPGHGAGRVDDRSPPVTEEGQLFGASLKGILADIPDHTLFADQVAVHVIRACQAQTHGEILPGDGLEE